MFITDGLAFPCVNDMDNGTAYLKVNVPTEATVLLD